LDQRTKDILERITDEFFALDREWRYVYINEPALDRIRGAKGEGLLREDILGKITWEVYPEFVGSVFYEELQRALREQETVAFEAHSALSDKWFEVRAYPSEEGLSVYSRAITERKLAEEQLGYHARLLENVHDAVIATDERYIITAWNKGAEQMYGWRADEVLGRRLWEAVPTDLSEEQRAEALRDLEEKGRLRTEAITYGKDGTPVYVEGITIALREETDGEIAGYVNIRRDISEHKKAEDELRESSRQVENILESITDAFVAVDHEWRYTYINERALRRMQQRKGSDLPREAFLGKNMWEEFPEVVGTTIYEKYHEAMREHKSVEFETYFPPSEEWIEAHAYPSEGGLAIYYRDITERKRAEEETQTRARQQAAVAELGLTALAGDDLDSLMDEVVACVARTLGVEYSKIVELLPGGQELLLRAGTGFEEGLVGRAREPAGLRSQAGYTLLSEQPVIVEDLATETRFRLPPLVNERGAVSGMSVVIQGRDGPFGVLGALTIRHRSFSEDDANFLQAVANVLATAIEREGAQEQVEEGREAERSRIARDIHDEPLQELTDALVQLQQIQRTSEDPQQTLRLARLLATLDRIGPQLRGAIYDLRLEGEQTRLFPELLESLVELHRGMAPEFDIALEVHDGVLSGPLGERGRQLLHIIGEAITNVRRHSGASRVHVGVGITEEKLWADVVDDGVGFDATQKQQEDSEEALSATGGLGIRGMRERARALGGDLEIESDPETGTKVRFEMTLTPDREEPEELVHVMLVEDHTAIREALAATFEREEGFEVVGQAGSLSEAREMLGAEPAAGQVGVAVVDLRLPDGYGGDLITDLREANPQAQVLVLSASLDRPQIARAVEAGAAGVLHKTAHLEEVVAAVRRLKAGETLMPLEEVVELLRFAGSEREREYEARQAIENLTSREIEVLQALAEGLDSAGIAERLHISIRTERNHMANILSKLGVHSQLQALVFALRHGVVQLPSDGPRGL
jgi:PAS domain S-box-containing protein